MRVLHVYSGNLYGGIEAILHTLAVSQGPVAVTHAFALCFDGRLSRELVEAGSEVHLLGPVRLSRPRTLVRARAALAQVLAAGTFDRVICHAPWSQALFGSVARHGGAPVVFWAHNVMTGRHWTERLARRCPPDAAICNSAFTATTLGALYPGLPFRVVHAPVTLVPPGSPVEPEADTARGRLRQALDTPESAIVIVTACRSEAGKGHEVLVRALAEIREVPGWIWWQAGGAQRPGEVSFLESIRAAARAAGIDRRVRWLGERDDVARLLRVADICCQPNVAPESFGIVFLEALGAGLPVVTSNLGGAPEIVDDTCGVLVSPGDAHGVAAALRRLIEHPDERRRKGAAGPARAKALADPPTQIRRLVRALVEMTPTPCPVTR